MSTTAWGRWAMVVTTVASTFGAGACASDEEPKAEPEEQAEPDFFEVYVGSGPVGDELAEDEGELIGPHFDLKITALGHGDSLHDLFPASTVEQLHAADGREFVAATILNRGPMTSAGLLDSGGPSVTIAVGDRLFRPDDMPPPAATASIVVSVPAGETAELRIDDDGRAQAIDLRTGERTEQISAFYSHVGQDLDFTYTGSGTLPTVSAGGLPNEESYEVTLPLEQAFIEPWASGLGYAAEGRAWLHVSHDGLDLTKLPGQPVELQLCGLFMEVPAETTFTIVEEGGHEIPAEVGVIETWAAPAGDVHFDVPEGFTTATLRITPGASPVRADSGSGDQDACSWITTPAPQTVPIHLTEAQAEAEAEG